MHTYWVREHADTARGAEGGLTVEGARVYMQALVPMSP